MKKIAVEAVVWAAVMAVCILTSLRGVSQEQMNVELVEGRASVKGGKVSDARARALENAFENRVRQKTAEILPPVVIEGDSAALEEKIFSRSRDFVSRYMIAREFRDGDVYVVEAEVFVSEEALRSALLSAGLMREKETGLIFLMVVEEIDGKAGTWWNSPPGQTGAPSVSEAFLAMVLKNQGYTLVEPIPSQPRPDVSKLTADPDSEDTLRALTGTYGAGIFIYGRGRAIPVEEKPDMRTIVSSARLDLKITGLEDKTTIARFSAQARSEADTTANAGALALEQAARSMVPEVLARLEKYRPQAQIPDKGKIVLSIGNLYSYKLYMTLSETVSRIPGVMYVELWGFSPGTVKFLVQYQGEPIALANVLARKTFDDFNLTIVELDKNRIELRVNPVRHRALRP